MIGEPISQLNPLPNEREDDVFPLTSDGATYKQERSDMLRMEDYGIQDAQLAWVDVDNITAGTSGVLSVVKDSTNAKNLKWTGTLNCDLDVAGAGGLDTGTRATDTWYAVYIIGDTDGSQSISVICSTNTTTPTLPTGYDLYRRVGYFFNDSSDEVRAFFQIGKGRRRDYLWDVVKTELVVLAAGSATNLTAVNLDKHCPPSAVSGQFWFSFTNTADTDSFTLAHNDTSLATATAPINIRPGIVLTSTVSGTCDLLISGQSIKYGVTVGTNTLTLTLYGWSEIL